MIKRSIVAASLLLALTLVLGGCGGLSEAEKHYIDGVGLYEEGRLEEAIAEYDQAIELDPQYALAYTNRGNAYAGLGQLQRAIQDFDEAIRLDPQDAGAYSNRGGAYVDLGQPQRAIEDLDEAIQLDPNLDLFVKTPRQPGARWG